MNDNEFGLCVKMANGYIDLHPIIQPLHDVKSVAGRMFHNESVISACVYDKLGTARLYLKKTPLGVVREER
jgi:hypothetical protein